MSVVQDSQARRAARLPAARDARVARRHGDGRCQRRRVRFPVGTWGPGAFDNIDALDLLDALSGLDAAARRIVLERIFREAREHPENLNFTLGAAPLLRQRPALSEAVEESEFVGLTGQRQREVREVGAAVSRGEVSVDLYGGLGSAQRFPGAAQAAQQACLLNQGAGQG